METSFHNPMDNDHDINEDSFYNDDSKTCKYLSPNLVKGVIEDSTTFSLLHVNCRSLNSNFNKLNQTLDVVSTNFSIIGVTETWTSDIDDNDNLYCIPDYNSVFLNRKLKPGGGVCLYIKKDLTYKTKHYMSLYFVT